MGHSYQAVYIHLVFSTKGRKRCIPPPDQAKLWRYLAGIAVHHEMKALAVGGCEEHVHLLLSLAPDLTYRRR